MENSEDFVVVDEDPTSEKKLEIERLRVLVELFTKALDTLNQSNVLLKDELQSALSVTLQHVCPDRTSSTDDLIKLLDSNVSSPEEVRANYVKRLCSRLVAVNDEKMALLAENTNLREMMSLREKEFSDKVADANLTAKNIEMVLTKLEGREVTSGDVSISTSMADLCENLNSINERLSKLQLKPTEESESQTEGATSEPKASRAPTTVSVGVLTSEEPVFPSATPSFLSPISPPVFAGTTTGGATERINPQLPCRSHIDDDLSEFGLPSSRRETGHEELAVLPANIGSIRTEGGAGRGTPQPSYSANQEEPWCPCCQQRFASRDELETHLLNCLT